MPPQLPSDICNRSLDSFGHPVQIGSMTDGTMESEACRRVYGPTLRQLLRTANWNFARKQAPLQLLGDSTGQTLDPLGNPISTQVEWPWIYAYAWPNDGVKARWMPMQLPQATTNPPIMTGLTQITGPGLAMRPARFLISSSDQFPVVIGQTDWDSFPDLSGTEGVGYVGRRIVLTNVQNASLVYTKLTLQIEEWDELFAEAMVATIASRLVMVLSKDKKFALSERAQQVAIAQGIVREARTANANDAGFPMNVSREASWIAARALGSSWGWGSAYPNNFGGAGYDYVGWDAVSWADGSVY